MKQTQQAMSASQQPASSVSQHRRWEARASEITMKWRSVRPAPRHISAVRGAISVPSGGPLVGFESNLERQFLTLMRIEPRVRRVVAQPGSLHFLDVKKGAMRRYSPDFLIEIEHGAEVQNLLVEVKTCRDLYRGRRACAAGYAAARLWAATQPATQFLVVTERRMGVGAWLRNAETISHAMDRRFDDGFLTQCLDLVGTGERQIQHVIELGRKRNINPESILSALYQLIGKGRIHAELAIPIDRTTWLCVNEHPAKGI